MVFFDCMSKLPSNKYWNRTKNKSVHVQMDLYGSFMCRFMSELPSNKYWNRTENKSVHIWICMVPLCAGLWVSCLQINTEIVQKQISSCSNGFVWFLSVCRFMSELPSNKFKRFLLFLACVDISRITLNKQIPTVKTLQYWLYSICFRFACTQTLSQAL